MKNICRQIVRYWLFVCVRIILWRFRPLIIAITGSTDKTTAKDAFRNEFQRNGYSVSAHPRSFNTDIGLPLAILSLESGERSIIRWLGVLGTALLRLISITTYPSILIVELGSDRPGDLHYLLGMVRPTIAVITTVTSQYISHFGDLEKTAEEFSLLAKAIPLTGLVILNADDPRVSSMSRIPKSKYISIGSSTDASARIESVENLCDGQTWQLRVSTGDLTSFSTTRIGAHHRFAISAAFIARQWIKNQSSV